jgi:hypothetical protein
MALHAVQEKALQEWALESGLVSKEEYRRVYKLTIVLEVGDVARVTVQRYVEGEGHFSVPAPDMKHVDVTVTE